MVDWPFVEGDLERQAMPTYLGGQGAVNVALRKTINDLVYTYLIKLLTPCWPRIEKALVLTDYDDDASPQLHLNLQGASSPFHPQPRVPPFFFPPSLAIGATHACNVLFLGTSAHGHSPCKAPASLLVHHASYARSSACPRDSCARRPALHARDLAAGARPCRATAPGATHACLRATSQRAPAPAERQAATALSEPLHPGQPMSAASAPPGPLRETMYPMSAVRAPPGPAVRGPPGPLRMSSACTPPTCGLTAGARPCGEIHNCMTDLSINP
jgi:hypothetical protein